MQEIEDMPSEVLKATNISNILPPLEARGINYQSVQVKFTFHINFIHLNVNTQLYKP
jgi:hypothetical protein